MKYPIVSVLFFILAIPIFGNSKIDSLLQVLDHAIAQSEVFENSKKDRIGTIKEQLLQYPISDDESYRVNDLLYQEYEFYISDSARHYIDRCINIAWKNNDGSRLAHSKIRKANLLATAGLYPEAIELLHTVDASFLSRQDSARYYLAFEHTYLYHAEYVGGDEVIGKYLASRDIYRDSALMLLPESSYLYTITKASRLIDEGLLDEAETMLLAYLPKVNIGTRDHAVLTSILAFLYECANNREMQKTYLIKSALSDIQAVVKENNSLRALSEILYVEGQIARADLYVKSSLKEAMSACSPTDLTSCMAGISRTS